MLAFTELGLGFTLRFVSAEQETYEGDMVNFVEQMRCYVKGNIKIQQNPDGKQLNFCGA